MTDAVRPLPFAVPDAALEDLRERLARTRWPDRETVDDWRQGVPLERLQALVAYWRDGYDWRAQEARLNQYPQFTTEIDGQRIHFLHLMQIWIRSEKIFPLPVNWIIVESNTFSTKPLTLTRFRR